MPNTREKLICDKCSHKIVCKYKGTCDECNQFATNGDKWISVKDRLPETGYKTMVIVCVDGKKTAARWFERTIISGKLVKRFKYPWDVITCENITHWMPLPEPPKGE